MRYLLLPLFLIPIITLSSCGQEPPVSIENGDPISEITTEQVDAWNKTASVDVAQQCAQRGGSPVAQKRCIRQGSVLVREQVINGLIGDAWVRNEAKESGLKITSAERKRLDKLVDQNIKQAKAKQQGKTTLARQYVVARAEAEFMLSKLAEDKIKADKIQVSDSQAKAQYNKNKKKFSRPANIDTILVTTKDKAIAKEVAQQLRKGADVNKVLDDLGAPKDQNPELKGITKSDVPKQARFLFSLPKGKIFGPKEIDDAWVVAQVTKIRPAKQFSFNQVKQQLKREGQTQIAVRDIRQELTTIWRPKTKCAEGYNSPLCSNRSARGQSGIQ